MSDSGSGQGVGFDIIITAPGAEQTLDATGSALTNVGTAALKSAEGLDAHNVAAQRVVDVTEQLARAEAEQKGAFEQSQAAVTEMTASQKSLAAAGVSLEQVLAAVNGTTKSATASARDDAAARREQAQAMRDQIALGESMTRDIQRQNAMILMHTEALRLDAATSGTAAQATGAHGIQLGRLNMELGTAIGRFTGVNTGVTRLGAQIGGAAAGYGIMIAISVAIAAAAKAYDVLTESTRKAKEEQEKETKALEDWYRTQELGKAGEREKQIQAETKALDENQKKLIALNATLAQQQNSYDAKTGLRDDGSIAATRDAIAKLSTVIQHERDVIAAANKDVVKSETDTFLAQRDAQVQAISDRLHYNEQDGAARKQALELVRQDQALYQQYLKAPVTPETSALVAAYAKQLQQLDDLLYPKQHGPSGVGTENPVIAGLQKQLSEMQKVNAENNKELAAGDARLAMLRAEGVQREYLANQAEAEAKRLQAYATLSGPALTARLQGIDAEKKQADELTHQKTVQDDARSSLAFLNEQIANVTAIGKHNEAITEARGDTQKWTDANRQLSESLANDVLRAVEQFASRGSTSLASFIEMTERLADTFHKSFASEIEQQTKLLEEANSKQERELAKSIESRIESLKKYGDAAAAIGGAISIAQGGYNAGVQTGNPLAGALSGGLSGFEIGKQIGAIGGPLGAAAGALLGAAGGMLGAAKAHDLAVKAFEEATAQFKSSLSGFEAQIYGGGANVKLQIDQINQTVQGLLGQARTNEVAQIHVDPSSRVGARQTYSDNLTKIDQDGKDAIAKLGTDFLTGLSKSLNELNGPAGQLTNSLNDADKAFTDNESTIAALLQNGAISKQQAAQADADAQKLHDETAAKAKAAYDESILQQKEDFAVRTLAATGTAYQVEQMKQEVAWRRELAAATDDATRATIEAVQAAEKAKQAADHQKLIDDTNASLAVRAARATGHSDQADTLQLQIDQAKELYDAQQQGLDDATLANLKYVQSLEATQLAAQQAENALQRTISGIKEEAQLFGYTSQQTLDAEAAQYGFLGLTRDQILALYTKHGSGDLTPEQEQQNQHIAQYLQDLDQSQRSSAAASASGSTPGAVTSQVQNDIANLSEGTGSRLADYTVSQYYVSRDILAESRLTNQYLRQLVGAGGSSGSASAGVSSIGSGGRSLTAASIGAAANIGMSGTYTRNRLAQTPERG